MLIEQHSCFRHFMISHLSASVLRLIVLPVTELYHPGVYIAVYIGEAVPSFMILITLPTGCTLARSPGKSASLTEAI
jgi:hypothetical protein